MGRPPGACARAMLVAVLLGWAGMVIPPAAGSTAPEPRVIAVQGHLELDVLIEVEVENLGQWVRDNPGRSLVPWLDGLPIAGLEPRAVDLRAQRLIFHLSTTPGSRDNWRLLLGAPEGLRRPVTFSVGPAEGPPFPSAFDRHNPLPLTVISPVYGVVAAAVVLVALLVLVHLARNTRLIRRSGPRTGEGALPAYDLARFQMAFWFFLVFAGWTSIWLVTDDPNAINASILALMGISAGTALGDAVIDAGDRQHTVAAAPRSPASRGFLVDLVSDEGGCRLDRFQSVAFTAALGMVFCSEAYNHLDMPVFSPSLLALMGLSSGTYLGFRLPGRAHPGAPPPPPPPPPQGEPP